MGALLGREKDLEAVRRFLVDAAVDGRALLLTGPAGIGRTALLDAAVATASGSGALVARTAGAADEADLPFAGLSRLLAPFDDVVARLDPDWRAVLSAALDHGRSDGDDGSGGGPADGGALVAAVAAALEAAAAGRPVVVAVDDLPTMDVSSGDCLRALGRRAAGRRIALLATARTAAPTDGLPVHALTPLDEETATALLALRAPRPGRTERDRLLREAEGNPLALWELPVRSGDAPGPRLASLFGDHVTALSPSDRRLLLCAALADTGDLDVLLGPGVPVPDELRRAGRSGLVRVTGRRLSFSHPAARASVTAAATAGERRQAHAALAGALADRPDRRRWHRSEAAAGPDEELARELEESALLLLGRGDAAGATAALRRCSELTPPGPARLRRAAHAAYVDAAVGGTLDAVATQPDDAGAVSLWAAAARAHVLFHRDGDLDAAHRILVDAVEASGSDPEAEPAALTACLDTLASICRFADRDTPWSPVRAPAAGHAARLAVEPARLAPGAGGAGRVSRDGGVVGADRAGGAGLLPADPRDPEATVRAGWSLLAVDGVDRVGPALRRVLADGVDGGAAGSAADAAVLLVLDAFAAGRWDDACRLADQGRALCASHGDEAMATLARVGPALVAACRGDDVVCRDHTGAMIGWAAPRGLCSSTGTRSTCGSWPRSAGARRRRPTTSPARSPRAVSPSRASPAAG